MHGVAQMLIEERGGTHYDSRADQVERGLERVGANEKHRERDQGRHAAARQHPIIDLQHVEGAGEHQQVHAAGKDRHAPKGAPAILQARRTQRDELPVEA